MAYYVLGPGGAKHGPAELHTLNDWITQGRISPETLIEDSGSGTKMPARAIQGLQFAGGASLSSSPAVVSKPMPPAPSTTLSGTPLGSHNPMASNYIRPGLGTGGSDRNLFLPDVNSKWALHGFLAAGGGLLLGVVMGLITWQVHFHFGRISILSIGLPIYGIRCGAGGFARGEGSKAVLVVAANILAMLVAIAAMIWGFASW